MLVVSVRENATGFSYLLYFLERLSIRVCFTGDIKTHQHHSVVVVGSWNVLAEAIHNRSVSEASERRVVAYVIGGGKEGGIGGDIVRLDKYKQGEQ